MFFICNFMQKQVTKSKTRRIYERKVIRNEGDKLIVNFNSWIDKKGII